MPENGRQQLTLLLDQLTDSLKALRGLGRQLSVKEEQLVALAKASPKVRPSMPTLKAEFIGNPGLDTAEDLETVREILDDCQRCKLAGGRKNLVFGDGNPRAELMFIGEGPGADEDEQGLPFVGRAGQLLNRMIAAMGKRRDEVYIANIVKCRPPGNREPEPDEVTTCAPFLQAQIKVIQPKVICCLGRVAAQNLLQTKKPITQMRGQWLIYHDIKVLPTYHPAFLLRNPAGKKPAWEDLQKVMAELGWQAPKKGG